jgi:hypothetical protein
MSQTRNAMRDRLRVNSKNQGKHVRLESSDVENKEILTGKSSVKNCTRSDITVEQTEHAHNIRWESAYMRKRMCAYIVIESFKFDVALFINSILNQMK